MIRSKYRKTRKYKMYFLIYGTKYSCKDTFTVTINFSKSQYKLNDLILSTSNWKLSGLKNLSLTDRNSLINLIVDVVRCM